MTYQGQRFILKHLGLFGIHPHSWEKDWCVLRKFFLTRHLDDVFENYRAVSLQKVMILTLFEDESCGLGPKLVNDAATLA
jgi:hypothetical protein